MDKNEKKILECVFIHVPLPFCIVFLPYKTTCVRCNTVVWTILA